MYCLLFPGQGTHLRDVDPNLFAEFPDQVAEADTILGYSITELCLDGDGARRLRDTRFAQPAIFFVNALLAVRAMTRHPDRYRYFAGHSLGEYNALVAAGCLDLRTALALVRDRADLMARVPGGGMAAVAGLAAVQVERTLMAAGLPQVYVANRNSDRQTVIAGERSQLGMASSVLKRSGARQVSMLNVSGPFHTPLMAAAGRAFSQALRGVHFDAGHAPVVSSVTGQRFEPTQAADLLSRQIASPVEWVRAVLTLRAAGVQTFDEVNGTTLTSLIKGIG
ncbi:acyltransferase domain-containing protein [Micromonospora sp. CPCC 205371]|nr:acyltransferase domain-containing protein [Micromonospora sp. CPCC 205371]